MAEDLHIDLIEMTQNAGRNLAELVGAALRPSDDSGARTARKVTDVAGSWPHGISPTAGSASGLWIGAAWMPWGLGSVSSNCDAMCDQ